MHDRTGIHFSSMQLHVVCVRNNFASELSQPEEFVTVKSEASIHSFCITMVFTPILLKSNADPKIRLHVCKKALLHLLQSCSYI